jgi:hypothetical protein
MLAACSLVWAQPSDTGKVLQAIPRPPKPFGLEQPDARRTKDELYQLLGRYPPTLQTVLAIDPGLIGNESYLAPYPELAGFLSAHPEISRNPSFFLTAGPGPFTYRVQDHAERALEIWRDVFNGLAVFLGFGMGISLIVWLIRTLVDYRRWNRLTRTQSEFHTKLLDRFTANNDLLAYVQSPAGARFLQSAPITLDAAPRSMGAPFGRILWSLQGGVVLIAAGIGLSIVSGRVGDDASQPLQALGVIGIALGLGFAASAIISFVISRRLGLIETRPSGTQE